MSLQDDSGIIQWRIHLNESPRNVYRLLSTSEGRARFWAESAVEEDGHINFIFPGGQTWCGKIIESNAPHKFCVAYYGGSIATFSLEDDGRGGTDLTLTDEGVAPADKCEVMAGWVSVLLALKAAADFSVDLRNHDPLRTWSQGFADN